MRLNLTFLFCCFALFSPQVFGGGDWVSMEGAVGIGARNLTDPEPTAPIDMVYIVIKSQGAKRIYEQMVMSPERDECSESGVGLLKRAGNLVCRQDGPIFECDIGISLTDGQSDLGLPC